MSFFFIVLLKIYRTVISPLVHAAVPVRAGCRFSPTCSEVFEEAVRNGGAAAGIRTGFGQLARCHPFARAS
ncbi:MAG TPA: membrane protein insertion efficiency factor YidD [Candidatus Paceibacterota bacterium]|nr:membrane protein insertion efficiency factor YidD [Candidatus Paceibacterota bacterium]